MALIIPSGSAWSVEKAPAAAVLQQPVTVEQAVNFGLANNPVLRAAEQNVNAADQGVKAARADFLPKVDTSYSYTHWKEAPFATIQSNALSPGSPSRTFQTNDTNINHWEIDLTQPLFTGYGLTAQHEIAKLQRGVAVNSLAEARLNLIRNIRYGFLQVLLAERLLEVARENIVQLEAHRKNAEAYYVQGLTPRNDVLKADVALADARQREKASVKQVTILRSQLNRLLALDENAKLDLVEWNKTPSADRFEEQLSLEALYGRAEKKRPELRSIATTILEAEQQMRVAKSRLYPQVSLFTMYYREGKDFLAGENDFINDHNLAAGVRVDWNWFEGGKTMANLEQARYRRKALKKSQEDLVKQVHLEIEDSYEQLLVAKVNLKTATVAVEQAKENLRITTAQYREQVVIFSEVLDSQVYLLQAQTNYYQALYGYQLAWVDLERAVGASLDPTAERQS